MEPEELRFDSGGAQCAAWLFRPAAPGGDDAPCVVLGTGASCVYDQGLALYAERFAESGLAALAFDYRYFGHSSGEPRGLARPALQPRLTARLRGDHLARLDLAQRALRPRRARAPVQAGAQDPPHRLPDPLLHHDRGRRQPARSG